MAAASMSTRKCGGIMYFSPVQGEGRPVARLIPKVRQDLLVVCSRTLR